MDSYPAICAQKQVDRLAPWIKEPRSGYSGLPGARVKIECYYILHLITKNQEYFYKFLRIFLCNEDSIQNRL